MANQAVIQWVKDQYFEGASAGHTLHIGPALPSGTDQGMSPMALILVALGSCTGIDVVDILHKGRHDLTGLSVEVTGERALETPKVYTSFHVVYRVRGRGLAREVVERAVRLSEEKYCTVGLFLSKAAPISSEIIIEEERTPLPEGAF